MKVKDLIAELAQLNADAEVLVVSSNPELRGAYVASAGASIDLFEEKNEQFRDMMDYQTYYTSVYHRVAKNGDWCVTIS